MCKFESKDLDELIAHSETHFSAPKETKPVSVETEACPVCRKKFAVTELVKHFEQDHSFI